MSQTTIFIIVAVIVVIALLLLFLIKGRKQHVSLDATAPLPTKPAAPKAVETIVAPPAINIVAPEEGHGVGSEAAAAIEDVIDQFIGIDAHPSGSSPRGHGDTLTLLKGLGPKAEARLHDVGVFTFDQIAAWDAGDIAAIDAQMGAFKGRIERDQWVAQARLLAVGDTAGFEERYGKLGG